MEKIFMNTNDQYYQKGFGIFETMRFINGKINFEKLHFERLFDGMERLRINRPESFTNEKIRMEIEELCKKNNCYQKARVRLSVIAPFDYFIETFPLDEELNKEGLVIDIFPGEKKNWDAFSNLKLTERSLYEKAEEFARHNKLDDCLILNEYDRICESTIANIFWIKNDVIYTPPLSEGCVAGVMRRYLLQQIRNTVRKDSFGGYGIQEKELSIEELIEADEVFLTNAVRGIRWVRQFRDKVYLNTQTLKIEKEFLENFLPNQISG
jgi:branched-chain amino acid aminotransferase